MRGAPSGHRELRAPTIIKAFGKPRGKVDFIESFEKLVLSIRRKAIGLSTLEARAELVDAKWHQLKTEFRRREIAADFAEVVRRCLYAETVAWHWFGHRLTWPPGEGE